MTVRILTPAEATAIQKSLNSNGANLVVDGHFGALTEAALIAFQTKYGILPDGNPSAATLAALGISSIFTPAKGPTMATPTIISGAIASAEDYFLNFISSKINWTAGVMVGVLVTFVSTKFGFNVPPETAQWLTVEISGVFAAIIVLLRTFLNKPRVMAGTTVTVQK